VKTVTTDWSKFSRCLIRKRWVADTPEERVRQNLIQKMIGELGYPKGLISVEKKIGERRYDLVCYTKSMQPLLLVECKAEKIDEAAENQAVGYNASLKAPFICLASPTEIKTLWQEREKIGSVPFLPTYSELYDFSRRI
jgi:hypothetical protein